MECSTHSEKWDRLGKLTFDIGVITNISDDHYSPYEHSGFEEYLSYKLAIIKRFKNAVINIDDLMRTILSEPREIQSTL